MMVQIFALAESLIQLAMITMVGIYFIFSNTVMSSLKAFESGADVMVEINRVILNPFFMVIFWVSGGGSLYLFFATEGLVAASGLVFFIGTSLVTVVKNMPLNNALRDTTEGREQIWQTYLNKWVFWNHVRSLTALASSFLLVV